MGAGQPATGEDTTLLTPYAYQPRPCRMTACRGTVGVKAVNKGDVQLKVTIVPGESTGSGEQWALIVSISHTIADGYTYYQAS